MIGHKSNYQQDRKYLPVWEVFDPVAKVLAAQARDDGEKWGALARLVRSLCAKPSA